MNFDLRFPIGLMFGFYGLVLVIYGIVTNGSSVYQRSLGLNVNLIWGAPMFAFGALLFILALRKRISPPE
jgi:hypothetical protein